MYIDEEPRLVRTGWLHKKGAVGKMLLGRQWEQRWVQLTSQTFTYAKTEKDMLSGRYKVFKTSELIGTMPGPSNVFQVQFPEAALQFKAASSNEAAAWVKDVRGVYKGEAGVSLPEQSQSPVVSQSGPKLKSALKTRTIPPIQAFATPRGDPGEQQTGVLNMHQPSAPTSPAGPQSPLQQGLLHVGQRNDNGSSVAGAGSDQLQSQLAEEADTSAEAASATFSPLSAHAPSWRGQQGGGAADTHGLPQGPQLLHHRGGHGAEASAAPGLASGNSTPRHAAEVGSAQLPGGGLLREGRGTGLGSTAAEQGPGREGQAQGVGLGSRLARLGNSAGEEPPYRAASSGDESEDNDSGLDDWRLQGAALAAVSTRRLQTSPGGSTGSRQVAPFASKADPRDLLANPAAFASLAAGRQQPPAQQQRRTDEGPAAAAVRGIGSSRLQAQQPPQQQHRPPDEAASEAVRGAGAGTQSPHQQQSAAAEAAAAAAVWEAGADRQPQPHEKVDAAPGAARRPAGVGRQPPQLHDDAAATAVRSPVASRQRLGEQPDAAALALGAAGRGMSAGRQQPQQQREAAETPAARDSGADAGPQHSAGVQQQLPSPAQADRPESHSGATRPGPHVHHQASVQATPAVPSTRAEAAGGGLRHVLPPAADAAGQQAGASQRPVSPQAVPASDGQSGAQDQSVVSEPLQTMAAGQMASTQLRQALIPHPPSSPNPNRLPWPPTGGAGGGSMPGSPNPRLRRLRAAGAIVLHPDQQQSREQHSSQLQSKQHAQTDEPLHDWDSWDADGDE